LSLLPPANPRGIEKAKKRRQKLPMENIEIVPCTITIEAKQKRNSTLVRET
jgi:hypothetical protein